MTPTGVGSVEVVVDHEALDFDITGQDAAALFMAGYEQAWPQLESRQTAG
jgi:hypothetical protein